MEIEEKNALPAGEETREKHTYRLTSLQRIYLFIKAMADFLIALLAVILLSPVFLIVAIAIKIDSRGPVFFKQKRIGKKDFCRFSTYMVGTIGIEPMTLCMSSIHSNQLSYAPERLIL